MNYSNKRRPFSNSRGDLHLDLLEVQRNLESLQPGKIPRDLKPLIREFKGCLNGGGATGSTFTFFFVDPTGWTGFAMDNLRPILQRRQGELLINFMYDPINRFLSFENPANQTSLDRCLVHRAGVRFANRQIGRVIWSIST